MRTAIQGIAYSLLVFFVLMQQALAQESAPVAPPQVVSTQHTASFNGTRITYDATVGETILDDDSGKPVASIFSIAYVKNNVSDKSKRPVTFLWNGGPSSASLWLHMGGFGPVRVNIPSDARDDGAAPFDIIKNDKSILDVTDIVFIDPMDTGFSHTVGEGKSEDFYGVHNDAAWVAKFMRQWVSANGRWNSPKFLGGESYGTTRSAAVIRELEGRFNDMSINGIILVSTILDFSITNHAAGNEMGYVTFLPTMATTAAYHGKVDLAGRTIADVAEEARRFALGDYASALMKGQDISDDERANIIARMAAITGLSEDYIDRADLRVTPGRFQKELLRDEGMTVGRLDSRFKGEDYDQAGETPDTDPSFYGIDGAYTAAVNHYLRDTLGFKTTREYSVIGGLKGSWDFDIVGSGRGYANVAPFIGEAMRQNSGLRLFNAAGYYDFATPFLGAEYSLNRTGMVPERTVYKYYEAGHMMYIHHPSLDALMNDVRDFITGN